MAKKNDDGKDLLNGLFQDALNTLEDLTTNFIYKLDTQLLCRNMYRICSDDNPMSSEEARQTIAKILIYIAKRDHSMIVDFSDIDWVKLGWKGSVNLSSHKCKDTLYIQRQTSDKDIVTGWNKAKGHIYTDNEKGEK